MSNNKLYLKKYVRFREEKDQIFVCDLYTLENYSFPLEYLGLFNKLRNEGVEDTNIDIIDDLKTLELVSNNRNVDLFNSNIFNKLDYDESEFYN